MRSKRVYSVWCWLEGEKRVRSDESEAVRSVTREAKWEMVRVVLRGTWRRARISLAWLDRGVRGGATWKSATDC